MISDILDIIKRSNEFSKEVKNEFPIRLNEKSAVFKCDIALLTATPREFEVLTSLLDEVKELIIENNDSLIYYTARINSQNKSFSIIVPYPVSMGLESAVSSTTKTITHFSPSLIIMCGICAGNKNVTKIGDLIIAEKTVNYSNVVEIESSEKGAKKKFMQNADSINKNLKARLTLFANSKAINLITDKMELPPNLQPKCHLGLMVTGNSLLRSDEKMKEINDSYHGVKGMDMETHGLYFAASNSNKENIPLYASMKAVSDFGDETNHKISAEKRSEIALNISANSVIHFIQNYYR